MTIRVGFGDSRPTTPSVGYWAGLRAAELDGLERTLSARLAHHGLPPPPPPHGRGRPPVFAREHLGAQPGASAHRPTGGPRLRGRPRGAGPRPSAQAPRRRRAFGPAGAVPARSRAQVAGRRGG